MPDNYKILMKKSFFSSVKLVKNEVLLIMLHYSSQRQQRMSDEFKNSLERAKYFLNGHRGIINNVGKNHHE